MSDYMPWHSFCQVGVCIHACVATWDSVGWLHASIRIPAAWHSFCQLVRSGVCMHVCNMLVMSICGLITCIRIPDILFAWLWMCNMCSYLRTYSSNAYLWADCMHQDPWHSFCLVGSECWQWGWQTLLVSNTHHIPTSWLLSALMSDYHNSNANKHNTVDWRHVYSAMLSGRHKYETVGWYSTNTCTLTSE